jgi:ubiquinone/menaquinone biosynthesis C-methylase UbiE
MNLKWIQPMLPVDYNQISKTYDDVRKADIELIQRFMEEFPPSGELRLLDIGCGTGNYTDLLQKMTQAQGYQVYGVEPSDGMLGKARRKNPEVNFQQGSAGNIPFGDDFFDFVYMTDVIHHVPEISLMFAEIHRVLKPGGKVCIVTQSHQQVEARSIVRFFPGTARIDKQRYPAIDAIIAAAKDHSLRFLGQETLFANQEREIGRDYMELVRKKGMSMLHYLPEQEYREGLKALEDALQDGPIKVRWAGSTLVWFVKGSLR